MSHLMKSGKPCGRPDGHSGQHLSLEAVERKNTRSRNYRAENRAEYLVKNRANMKRYRAENLDLVRANDRAYYVRNHDSIREKQAKYRTENRDAILAQKSRYYRDLHDQAVAVYGDRCACCGDTDALEIDHVYGAGTRHIREMFGGYTYVFYRWLIDNRPAGFQVLCGPCNSSKHVTGGCRLDHALTVPA